MSSGYLVRAASLKHLAIEVDDATPKPVRGDLVRVHRGKPTGLFCGNSIAS